MGPFPRMPPGTGALPPRCPPEMTDLSLPPLSLAPPEGHPPPPAGHGQVPGGFVWPTPPYPCYSPGLPQCEPEACEIEGLNGKIMKARMTLFSPAEDQLLVQLPPSRTTVPVKLSQFRRLTLLAPLSPSFMGRGAAPAELMDFHPTVAYQLELGDGTQLTGRTVGHVENLHGLFLFPPLDEDGTVRRVFCAKGVYARASFGPVLGEVLLAAHSATPAQIANVLAEQEGLREQRLGDVLLNQNVLSREQLETALSSQSRMPMVRIGEALLALGFITPAQLDHALEEQRGNRTVPLGELLVRGGHIDRNELRTALARKMGYPVVQVDSYPVDPAALKQIPLPVARRMNVLPLQALAGRLVVALEDPSRGDVLEELAFLAQGKIVPVLSASDNLAHVIQVAYQKHGYEDSLSIGLIEPVGLNFDEGGTERLLADLELSRTVDVPADDTVEQSDNTLVRLINTMIVEAYSQGVSDIHIESHPGTEKLRIRFRRDGMLRPYLELPPSYRSAMIARIKIMCDLDISERRRPQDGKINFARFVPSCPVELRVATIPTSNSLEDAVLRILASARPIPLDQLSLSPRNIKALKEAVERPYGLVLCVGPTGSGKTTTLHSALSHINVPERKIWTAEDPVEITQPGLRQVQVNPKIDWTFAKALRAFLRADPDVIMVGEIRDQETAKIAVESSLTGHLVLSTLHTNSAAETVTRLLDMGMDPFNFADSLLAVLAQRLVRKLCAHCRTTEPMPAEQRDELLDDYLHAWSRGRAGSPTREGLLSEWQQRFGDEQGRLLRYHSPGCSHCSQTGVRGRVGVHELLTVSRQLRHLIQTSTRADDIQQQALAEGLRTLRQDGIEKVLAGLTTLEEVRATSNV
ncbi:MAG: ATPase, T2SS/T4P/T4SS family [Ideonella sp.]